MFTEEGLRWNQQREDDGKLFSCPNISRALGSYRPGFEFLIPPVIIHLSEPQSPYLYNGDNISNNTTQLLHQLHFPLCFIFKTHSDKNI